MILSMNLSYRQSSHHFTSLYTRTEFIINFPSKDHVVAVFFLPLVITSLRNVVILFVIADATDILTPAISKLIVLLFTFELVVFIYLVGVDFGLDPPLRFLS